MQRRWPAVISLLLLFAANRLPQLTLFPLHNDEGLHLTRAVEVWHGHIYWQIRDGKIINHWPIALFDPRNAADFAGRYPTVLVGLLGVAAGYALVRYLLGERAAVAAGLLWIASPYLHFFERLAQSDSQAGALVVVAVWACLLMAERGGMRYVVYTALAIAAAVQFKFTAAPYAVTLLAIIAFYGNLPWPIRIRNTLIIGVIGALTFVPPVTFLTLRGEDLFGIALLWLGGGADGELDLVGNFARYYQQMTGFGVLGPFWAIAVLVGLVTAFAKQPTTRVLVLAAFVPLLLILFIGSLVLPRHFVVTLPLLLLFAGAGLSLLPMWGQAGFGVLLGANVVLYTWGAVTDPASQPLPTVIREQYVVQHSAGYGLREAVWALPSLVEHDVPVVASMFPNSCERANFYGREMTMQCTDTPGTNVIDALLEEGPIYIVVDSEIDRSVDPTQYNAVQVGAFPRPGDTDPTVTIWRVEPRN